MGKDGHILAYGIDEAPDTACSQFQAVAAGGDVRGAIGSAWEHLMRTFSYMSPDSFFAEIFYLLDPKGNCRDRQSRLKMYLWIWASTKAIAHNLDRLIRGGPASCYYNFQPIEKIPDVSGLGADCEIIRREDSIKPLYSRDMNYKIPAYYYTFDLFVADRDNDYLMLDRILDCIDERIAITIRIQPVDISPQIQAHAAYLGRLASVNNRWDFDDNKFNGIDYTSSDGRRYPGSSGQLKPFSKKDSLVNDILQTEKQNHKTLRERQLSFRIKVRAKTGPVAGLIVSTLAEAAFKNGSYSIINGKDKLSRKPAKTGQKTKATSVSSLQHTDCDTGSGDYDLLRPLSRMATVDELSGIFRLPIGGYFSPCCFRKTTDPPPHERPENMIVLGYDMEIGGSSTTEFAQPRGVLYEYLNTHFFVTAMPGSGKTTVIMNLVLQLWE